MKVSVYIPCFNGARHIAQCIASLLAQSHAPDEIVVVDDGSADDSAKIADTYPVKLVRHDCNMGLATARNTGISATSGDIVASIDADCFASRDWLERLARTLERNPHVVGVAGCPVEGNRRRLADRWRMHHMPQNHGTKLVVNPPFLHGANTALRRTAPEAVNGYNTAFRTNGEDFDLCFRMRKILPDRHLIYDPRPKVTHMREDTVASVIRARFRYLFYSQAIYTPYDSLPRLRSRLAQIARINWRSIVWDLRKGSAALAMVSVGCLVYSAVMQVGEYARCRRARAPKPSAPASGESAGESAA
ncbi:MAG: glycosyltransferase family 2 protein [Alphaproteobacteria bacterium]|nr:glycosyltransferase family 2 protein [Alphaproteobacteria bacterium]